MQEFPRLLKNWNCESMHTNHGTPSSIWQIFSISNCFASAHWPLELKAGQRKIFEESYQINVPLSDRSQVALWSRQGIDLSHDQTFHVFTIWVLASYWLRWLLSLENLGTNKRELLTSQSGRTLWLSKDVTSVFWHPASIFNAAWQYYHLYHQSDHLS